MDFTNSTLFLRSLRSKCEAAITNSAWRASSFATAKQLSFTATSALLCDPGEDDMIAYSTSSSVTAVVMSFLETGYARLFTVFDLLFDALEGVIPNGLSYTEEPFRRHGGQTARCTGAAFMAFATDVLPVYRVVPVSTETTLSVTMPGVPAIEVGAVSLSVPLENVLPSAEYLVVGDPASNATVWDVPLGELSLAPSESGRRGKVTYAYAPTLDAMDPASWAERNGVPFDHYAATNVASAYETTINGQGECVRVTGGFGSWCTLRSLFHVQPATGATLQLLPKTQSSYRTQINLPLGDITAQLLSLCPTVSIVPQAAGSLVMLTSSLATGAASTLRLVENEGGACARAFDSVVVAAGATVRHFVPRCGTTPTLLTIQHYVTRDNVLELETCDNANALDVTTSLAEYQYAYGNAGSDYVNSTVVYQADLVGLNLAQIEANLRVGTLDAMTTIIEGLGQIGLHLPNSSYVDFLARFANLTLVPAGGAQRPGGNLNFSDWDAAAARFAARMAELNARAAAQRDELERRLAAAQAAQSELDNAALPLAERARLDKVNASRAWEAAQLAETNALLNTAQALAEQAVSAVAYANANGGWSAFLSAPLGPIADVGNLVGSVADAVVSIAEDGADGVSDLADAIARAAKDAVNAALGPLGAIGLVLATALLSFGFSLVTTGLGFLYLRHYIKKQQQQPPQATSGTAAGESQFLLRKRF